MNKNEKRVILILNILLVFGLLSCSIIFFVINKNFNPLEISGADYEAVHVRLLWRHAAETIFAVCSLIYIIGHIVIIYSFIRKRLFVSFRTIFLYFIVQISLMFICTVPFAVFDLSYLGDYLFPIWGTAGTLLLLLFVSIVIRFYQKRKET